MPKTRAQKEQIVSELSDDFGRMKGAVFTSISGYTMPDADGLRAKGRDVGVKFMVAKKTLLTRALKNAGIEIDRGQLEGSVLTAVGLEDEISAAKIVSAFLKDREGMKILGGIMEGKLIDAAAVKTLARLPGKQELLGKLVGSINAPVSGFVNVLAGNLRGLVTVLNTVKDKKTA
jgi:large subunit ribosomal protein L10